MAGVGGWIRFPKRKSDETKTATPPTSTGHETQALVIVIGSECYRPSGVAQNLSADLC